MNLGSGSDRRWHLPALRRGRTSSIVVLVVVTAFVVVGGGVASPAAAHFRENPSGPSTPPASALRSDLPLAPSPTGTERALPSMDGVGRSGFTPAALAPQWINVTPPAGVSNPPPTSAGSVAYDPAAGATVSFGGCTPTACPSNETWAYSNGTWVNLTNVHDAPPARYGAAMDYDRNLQGLLLFGGSSAGGLLNDTWLYQNGGWTNLTALSAAAPPPREDAAMAFDPAVEENGSVLFGGYVTAYGPANDTWVWQGWSGWVFLNTSSAPPVTELASMAYDPAIQAIVLFGCGDACVNGNNGTWELYSGQWWQVVPSGTIPVYRYGDVMTWDPALSAVVMFGGFSFTGYLDDTWTFSGGRWSEVPVTAPAPPARYIAGLSPDSSAFPPVLFGGSQFYPFGLYPMNDTWVYEVPPQVALGTPASGETSEPVPFTVTVANGTAPYVADLEFGDGTHAALTFESSSVTVAHDYLTAGTYYPVARVTDAAGVLEAAGAAAGSGLLIRAGPSLGPVVAPSPSDVNISVTFTGSAAAGGQPPYSYLWEFGDGGQAVGRNATHAYSTPGIHSGNLTATDAAGVQASVPFVVEIHSLPSVVLAVAPGSPYAGEPTTLYANVSGGTPPYTYAWTFGDGDASALPFPSHNFTSAGAFSVRVSVNDSVGGSAHQALEVTVGTAPPGPAPAASAGPPSWFWPGVAGIVAVAALGSFLLWRRGRSGPHP